MNIRRTDPTRPPADDPAKAKKNETKGTPFATSTSQPVETAATGGTVAPMAAGVTQADLQDPAKLDEVLTRCFRDMVDDAGQQLGRPVSDAQRRDLLEFLKTDPVMRGKLLKYLEQVVK